RIAPIPPSEPPLALLQIGVAETGMSRLEGRARMRVLSVANVLHKPAGISATSGVSLGMQGALDKQSPLPGVVWNTTTLRRWHSG
ncbi:hypothetical protein, partial [Shewanella algae]|uniref:hypothetical protein n=2 Tax=Shewanella algae TaxID=38313 RepID=UPI001C925817